MHPALPPPGSTLKSRSDVEERDYTLKGFVLAQDLAKAAAVAVVVLAGLVLISLVADWPMLRTWVPHGSATTLPVALILLILGLGLRLAAQDRLEWWFASGEPRGSRCWAIAEAFAAGAVLGSLGIFFRVIATGEIGLASTNPTKPSVLASLVCVLLSFSLLVGRRKFLSRAFQIVTLTAVTLTWFGLTSEVYSWGHAAAPAIMPLPTAVMIILLGTGILCLRPFAGLARLLLSPYQGGGLARWLLPVGLLMPALAGWLRLAGENAGLFSCEIGTALHAISLVAVLTGGALYSARRIDEVDRLRRESTIEAQSNLAATQQALKRATAFLEAAPGGMVVVDRSGIIQLVNTETERLFGWPREELLGQSVERLLPEAIREIHARQRDAFHGETTARLMAEGSDPHGKRRDGSTFPVEISLSPLETDGGRLTIASIRDVTEQRSSARVLAERSRQLAEAQRLARVGGWEWNLETNQGLWSDELWRIFGFDPSDGHPDPETLVRAIHPDDQIRMRHGFGIALQSKAGLAEEFRVIRSDGRLSYLKVRAELKYNESGRPVRLIGSTQDITEQKQAEQAVSAAEERWSFALEGADSGVWDWNIPAEDVYYSPRLISMLGYEPQEFGRQPTEWSGRIHPDDLPGVLVKLRQHLAGQKPHYLAECRMRCKDGSYKWILDRGKVVARSPEGDALRMVGTHTDITERREVEAELAQSRQMLQDIVDQLPQRVFWKDTESVYLGCNLASAQDAGIGATGEIVGKTDYDLDWKASAEAFRADDREVIQTGQPKMLYAEPMHRPDGTIMWLRTSKVPLVNAEGQIFGVLGTYEDVTEIKRAEIALQESEERFRNALEYSAIGIALLRPDGTWLKVNRSLCEIVGYSEAELLTKTFQDITHPDDLETDLANARRVLAGEITHYHLEKRYIHKEGHTVWVNLSASIVRDTSGVPSYFVAQIQDISQRREAEARLRDSLAEKEVLLKEVHHRVKNNMQVISSLLQLQAGYLHDPADKQIFRECQMRIQTMAIVHERLYRSGDFAQIDFGSHLRELCQLVHHTQLAEGRRYEMDVKVEPWQVSLDAAIPLGLIVVELLTNAFKHGFLGRDRGVARVLFQGQPDGGLLLEVSDNGNGLPPGFDFDKGRTLGLRLIRSLARQLRAEISIFPEEGAKFAVRLPGTAIQP